MLPLLCFLLRVAGFQFLDVIAIVPAPFVLCLPSWSSVLVIMSVINKATLFLGDLSTFCTERDIHMAFSPFGEVVEIKIMRSEETYRNLSYGFIKFAYASAAKKAMNGLNGVLFCGRHLRFACSPTLYCFPTI